MADTQHSTTEQVHCNQCLHLTKHFVLHEDKQSLTETYSDFCDISWDTTYTLLKCCGCESVMLRRKTECSEYDYRDFELEFYPPQISRQLPKWYEDLPDEMQELLKEIYTALHADSRRLALMGARTVIDMFMLEKIGDIGGFEKKLETLVEKGYLNIKEKNLLSTVIEAGNAAAHRGYKPKLEVLNSVIDIVEHLIFFYRGEKAGNSVKTTTPPRSRKKTTQND